MGVSTRKRLIKSREAPALELHGFWLYRASAELRAGGDGVVQHEKVQLFLALFLVDGGQEHPARFLPHHLSGRQVDDRGKRLADERLRLIEFCDAGEDLTVCAAAVVEREAQELVGFFHALAGLDLDGAEVGFAEGVEVDLFLQLRLDLNGGQEGLFLLGLEFLQLGKGLGRVNAGRSPRPCGRMRSAKARPRRWPCPRSGQLRPRRSARNFLAGGRDERQQERRADADGFRAGYT